MKKNEFCIGLRALWTLLAVIIMASFSFGQGVTSGQLSGKITDQNNQPIDGAVIQAIHIPSGTSYSTFTDPNGIYNISNMRVGNPYRIVFSMIGYGSQQYDNVDIRLGENRKMSASLIEKVTELSTVEVVGVSGNVGETSGAGTQVTSENIANMPTLNRDIKDFTRLTPQSASFGDASSFAGTNNRYNAIYIDGAVNNDVFGLAASGTNGGQTGISPFSMDIIDQVQVILSPYDVSYGGFAGAGISAVTKSGTNRTEGTAYYFLQNENLVGKTNKTYAERYGIADSARARVADFTKSTYGASLGGPIKKNKLFYFINAEIQKDETPILFDYSTYKGNSDQTKVQELKNKLINDYGYDPGNFGNASDDLDGLKLFGKIDWNINNSNRLTLRHSYTKAEQYDRNVGSSSTINFSNNGVYFPSTTNSSALELNSRFGSRFSNNLILGYTNVNDDRDAIGNPFPYVRIRDGAGTIIFGTEEFSTANVLDQKIFTLTDNFKIYRGKHTFTLGTHNEFYDIRNVFVGQNYGSYTFDSLSAFMNNLNASVYNRSYSLVDNLTGDETSAAAEFNAMQLGFYLQDEIAINNRFSLTAGLRLDVPIITSNPKLDTFLQNTAISKIETYYDKAKDVKVGNAPDAQLMWSPRLGFTYQLCEEAKHTLRGGIGVFTSRVPFVWPGGMFNDNGLTIGTVSQRDIPGGVKFEPGVEKQYTNPNFKVPSGSVDLFVSGFKYPQVLRSNLGLDIKLPGNANLSIEGILSKTLNNIVYTNINSDTAKSANGPWSGGGDDRTVYANKSIVSNYSAIYLASNTSKGSTYSITSSLSKRFHNGLSGSVSYTFGDAFSLSDGSSSQNSSQWRGQVNVDGRNNPDFGRSDYAIGHRVMANLGYVINWAKKSLYNTSITLFYDGHNNQAYSYLIDNASNPNGETGSTGRNRSLVYVPIDQNDITLVDYKDAKGNTISAATQWDNLNKYIDSDPYLSKHRGEYVEKNSNLGLFTNYFDLALRQDLGMKINNRVHKLQFSFDVFNLANLLNPKWGARYYVPGFSGDQFNYYGLYRFEKLVADPNNGNKVSKPTFSYRGGSEYGKETQEISNFSSRFQGRLGVRYIF